MGGVLRGLGHANARGLGFSSKVVLPTDPSFANVSALLHFDDSNGSTTFTDQTGKIWTRSGTTTNISTAQNKFGGSSLHLPEPDPAGISTSDHAGFAFGTADWTIEWWEYCTSNVGYQTILSKWPPSGTTGFLIQTNTGTGAYIVYIGSISGNSAIFTETGSKTVNTWQHHALVKDSGTIRKYRAGIQTGEAVSASNFNSTTALAFAADNTANYGIQGYADELRITKGVCRYPNGTTFTPSETAFPNS